MINDPSSDAYWVLPGILLAGSYPIDPALEVNKFRLGWLLDQGITFSLDLTEEGEYGLKSYAEEFVEEAEDRDLKVVYKRISIPDMETPTKEVMGQILDVIDAALEEGQSLFVHCYGGIGRTGTVVGCYLVRHGMEGPEAIGKIARLRQNTSNGWRKSPETEAQREMILNWDDSLA